MNFGKYGLDEANKASGKRMTAIQLVHGKFASGSSAAYRGVDDEGIRIEFEDETKLYIWDDRLPCCESRFMRTDDDLSSFVGAEFIGAEVRDGPTTKSEYTIDEIQFLVIHTDRGDITMSSHNDHNGYYGGFDIYSGWEP